VNKQPRLLLDHNHGEDWQPGKLVLYGLPPAVCQNTNKFQFVDTPEKAARYLQLTGLNGCMRDLGLDERCGMAAA
jgi:hypothetical protein